MSEDGKWKKVENERQSKNVRKSTNGRVLKDVGEESRKISWEISKKKNWKKKLNKKLRKAKKKNVQAPFEVKWCFGASASSNPNKWLPAINQFALDLPFVAAYSKQITFITAQQTNIPIYLNQSIGRYHVACVTCSHIALYVCMSVCICVYVSVWLNKSIEWCIRRAHFITPEILSLLPLSIFASIGLFVAPVGNCFVCAPFDW